MEPPSGLRQNLLQNYESFDNAALNDCRKPGDFKKLLFAFSFFHAIV
jgi:dynein heavy chain